MTALRIFSSRRRCFRDGADEGAYAILFALLVVTLVGMLAFVLDLALLRESRASTRSVADSAVVAAGAALKDASGAWTPRAACIEGWAYLSGSIGSDGSPTCSQLPATWTTTCPTTAQTGTWSSADWRVVWTWPVPQTSTLLTKPDTEISQSQVYNAQVDGASACDRIAVEIFKLNRLGFGAVFGVGDATTRAASVARNIQTGTNSSAVAALNILDTTNCKALTTDGQGKITVGTATQRGIIAVESDASQNNGPLSCGSNYAIDPGQGSKPGEEPWIRTVGPAGQGGKGLIFSFALSGTNALRAYPGAIGPPSDPIKLDTQPTSLPAKSGTAPVTAVFQTAINTLKGDLGGSGAAPSGYQTLPNNSSTDLEVRKFSCGTGTTVPVRLPAGNWYINCNTLNVKNIIIFAGGNVVAKGDIDIQAGGCLAVNVPATNASACPTITGLGTRAVTTNPAPSSDSVLYLRQGRLYRTGTGVLLLPRTLTFLAGPIGRGGATVGQIDVGGGAGQLLMASPLTTSNPFRRLTVWSESTAIHTIGGQGALGLRGVFFIPLAETQLTGQAGSNQTSAQFWTLRLTIKGQGEIIMDVTEEDGIARPLYGSTLIR